MAPAIKGFRFSKDEKSLRHGFYICFYVKIWGSHVGKVNWIAKKKQKMGFNIDFLLIFHVKGPKPQNRVNTA